jgi:hypothetical protein
MSEQKRGSRKPAPKSLAKKKKEEKNEPALKYVRGGSICDPDEKGARLIRGSGNSAVCRPTPGKDPRPRYRAAGS